MFVLQLIWASALLSVTVILQADRWSVSRAAIGTGALKCSVIMWAWGAALVASWLHARRLASQPTDEDPWRLLKATVVFGGALVTVIAVGGDYGIGRVASLPFLALGLVPLFAVVARLARPLLRADRAVAPASLPAPRAAVVALLPVLVFAAVAQGVLAAELPAELDGRVAQVGLLGLTFSEIAVYGPLCAVLIGLGLDRLDGSREGPLSKLLLWGAGAGLLACSWLRPYVSTTSNFVSYAGERRIKEPIPGFDFLPHGMPLVLLALGVCVYRDLARLGAGRRTTPVWMQLLVLVAIGLSIAHGFESQGLAIVPIASGAGLVLLSVLGSLRREPSV